MIYDAAKRINVNDISVGRGRWLRVRALPAAPAPIEIDALLDTTMPIWDALETECVAGCCGIDAFCFWPEGLVHSRGALSDVDVERTLLRLREALAVGGDDDVLVSTRLNTLLVRASFVQLVDLLIAGYRALR